jgi:excinuclease ABC subunit C
MVNPNLKSIIRDLPVSPGVYQYFDESGVIIYVGKAKNIRKRVSSYFRSRLDLKTTHLIHRIHHIEPIITKNEHEALLLENQLIKHYQPHFNILLKDDKTYPYIKVTTQEPFPRIIITRHKSNDGATYFGPYTSVGSIRKLNHVIGNLFPIRDCKQPIDRVKHQPKCIKLDIGKCIGPCIYKNIYDEYRTLINQCILFLEGKSDDLIQKMRDDMMAFSAQQAYEKAAKCRDHIHQLEAIQSQQMVELDTHFPHFFIGFSSNDHYHYGIFQQYVRKRFVAQHGKYASATMALSAFVDEFLSGIVPDMPNKTRVIIHSDYELALATYPHIQVLSPTKGYLYERLLITELNAQKSLIGLSKHYITNQLPSPLQLLHHDLTLSQMPHIIFGCDISHYYGTNIVSSVVVFIDGKPAKSYYRHFNITSVTSGKSDDVKSMKETVHRLLDHYDLSPDLLLIDGGKGQLNAALSALNAHNRWIDCIGLAKKNEDIYTPYATAPISLPHHHRGLQLLRFVRDEAHRFALNFQRKKRRIY